MDTYPHPPMSTERLIEYMIGERDKQRRLVEMCNARMVGPGEVNTAYWKSVEKRDAHQLAAKLLTDAAAALSAANEQ